MSITSALTLVHDGEQLMNLLGNPSETLPDLLFIDLNMPRKNGLECLSEIKYSERLKDIPVIIYSTSYEQDTAKWLHETGAQYYIRKPSDFRQLKNILQRVFSLTAEKHSIQPSIERFLLNDEILKGVT